MELKTKKLIAREGFIILALLLAAGLFSLMSEYKNARSLAEYVGGVGKPYVGSPEKEYWAALNRNQALYRFAGGVRSFSEFMYWLVLYSYPALWFFRGVRWGVRILKTEE